MIVDSSALLALIFREPGYDEIRRALSSAEFVAAGAPTLTETGIVLEASLGPSAHGLLERLLDEFEIQEVSFGAIHWREALDGFRRYGKGRHPAALNFGDCMTYAVARLTGEPLLCVGDDFPLTDLTLA